MKEHQKSVNSGTVSMATSIPVISCLYLILLTGAAVAADLSNDPMETKIQAAPANIMFLLDNSGSMDWEFMTPENDGIFHSEYFVYALSDNAYSNTSYALSGTKKIEWKSQWYGYNTIFYNPHSTYRPWPRWEVMADTEDASGVTISAGGTPPPHLADIINPRSNPINSTPTLDIHDIYYSNLPVNNGVIVDNQDGSPDFTTTGSWYESSLLPEWDNSSLYTTGNGSAIFTPDIPVADDYQIYAYWNCYDQRDMNALIEIDSDGDGTVDASERKNQRSSANNTPEAGVCGEWLPLFGGASFTLSAGHQATVSIVRDGLSTPSTSTVADAIAFVKTGTSVASTSVDIRNAHYYAVDDINADGIADPGEKYLVNFIWTDTNGDGTVDTDEVTRDYYLIYDDGAANNHEVITYVTPVPYDPADPANDNVPDSIQPRVYDELGMPVSFVTDYDDLQNFANWFSFYRKRELTAKAAVGFSVDDLEWVNVGYYTINSGVSQTVLPVKVDATNSVIVDNRDNGFTRSNSWYESGSTPEYNSSSLYTGTSGKWALWTPSLPVTEPYTVSGWWNCYSNRDQKAKFTINHAGGTVVKYLNQRASSSNVVTTKADCEDPSGAGCCGYWVDLGTYTFNQGVSGSVMVERHAGSTGSSTTADAIRFEGSSNVYVDSTNSLLNTLYSINSSGGTPLRQGLRSIGRYYDQDDGDSGNLGTSPYYSEADGGSCQQAYAIAMTDGYWNGNSPGVGNADGGTGSPYQDGYSETLADVAMSFYNDDLADGLPDQLPSNNYDQNSRQHMVTFSVSFGREGNIPLDDLDKNGVIDDPGYFQDPYFLNPMTPLPTWDDPNNNCYACPTKIDDLFHASVNGRGRFFQANDPDTLVSSLNELFKDISSRVASGASVSVNGDELSTGLVLYQSTYSSGSWVGDVIAYPINPETGEILKTTDDILWSAQDKLQDQDWSADRKIITYTGTPGTGVPFRYSSMAPAQQEALNFDTNLVDYLRGKELPGFRSRTKKLGDIVHSAPLLVGQAVEAENDGIDNNDNGVIDEPGEMAGGTIFAGGNDGMLHAFDAQSGRERFAYVPLHSFAYLQDLAKPAFDHRYFVDATPFAQTMTFLAGDRTSDRIDNDADGQIDEADEDYSDNIDNDGDGTIDEPSEKASLTLLVGALKKGGRGIYALDISNIEDSTLPVTETTLSSGSTSIVRWEYPPVPTTGLEYIYAGDQRNDGVDNDGDGFSDTDANEAADGDDENYSDGIDNDGDGIVDEQGEMALYFEDDDMGYSYSDPFIARSYKSYNETLSLSDNPWVVIFGNGYDSVNGNAVLYILDAWSGDIVRKIDTGAGGNNGLSTPALIDVDNDRRVDYVYAGDLKGNMWKFDLTSRDPEDWGVAFGTDNSNPAGNTRIDYGDVDATGNHDAPQPLFSASGQPITTAPDITFHCEKKGVMVIFGTGKFIGESDRTDLSQQSIFGIWDFDSKTHPDPNNYLGTWSRASNSFSNTIFSGVKLLEQTEVDWGLYTLGTETNWLRTLSDNEPNWYTQCDDGIDNDGDGAIDETLADDSISPERCIPVSPASYSSDGIDNDRDGTSDEIGEEVGNAGWFFDLPYQVDAASDNIDNDNDGDIDEAGETKLGGERIIKDVIIRDGKAIVISFIPEDSPCTGGGKSIIHEMDACDGSRMTKPVFDIDGNGYINDLDLIDVGITDTDGNAVLVPPTGIMKDGMLHTPVIVGDPNEKQDREMKIFSSSSGDTKILWEKKEKTGFYYWREY